MTNVHPWEARHPGDMIPATDDDIYFPNISPPELPTDSPIQSKERMTERINLWALGQLLYLYQRSRNEHPCCNAETAPPIQSKERMTERINLCGKKTPCAAAKVLKRNKNNNVAVAWVTTQRSRNEHPCCNAETAPEDSRSELVFFAFAASSLSLRSFFRAGI